MSEADAARQLWKRFLVPLQTPSHDHLFHEHFVETDVNVAPGSFFLSKGRTAPKTELS